MKPVRPIADESGTPYRPVRLPGFLNAQDTGLGDAIQRATTYIGIKACAGCRRRAAALNHWLVFTGGGAGKRGSL